MSFYLALVSPTDSPIYESSFPSSRAIAGSSSSSGPGAGGLSSSSASYSTSGGGGGGGGAFPSWSSFTGMNGVDLGDRLGRGSADLGGARPGSISAPGQIGGSRGQHSTINPQGPGAGGDRALMQMIAFKSLDGVEEVMETTGGLWVFCAIVIRDRDSCRDASAPPRPRSCRTKSARGRRARRGVWMRKSGTADRLGI